jgi:hypothetical protein
LKLKRTDPAQSTPQRKPNFLRQVCGLRILPSGEKSKGFVQTIFKICEAIILTDQGTARFRYGELNRKNALADVVGTVTVMSLALVASVPE